MTMTIAIVIFLIVYFPMEVINLRSIEPRINARRIVIVVGFFLLSSFMFVSFGVPKDFTQTFMLGAIIFELIVVFYTIPRLKKQLDN